jgi:hypothetical protein
MKIAYTFAPGRGDTDLLLYRLSQELAAKSIHCCGTVQINTDCAEGPCDMDVKVLPNGLTLRISQSLGTASKGCRLDPSALEEAVGLVEAHLSQGADLLIINKFGKHEADGRGFRNVIAQAIAQNTPVLVGVNALNLKAFEEFTGGVALQIEPTMPKILSWCQEAVQTTKNAA